MKKHTLAVDFDGTIVEHRFPDIGPLKAGAKEALERLHKKYTIVISSCRASTLFNPEGPGTSQAFQDMVRFLDEHQIPYDRIDDGTEGKIVAVAYIDDRAMPFADNWDQIARSL